MWYGTKILPPGKMGPRSWRRHLLLECDNCTIHYEQSWSKTWMRNSQRHFCSNKCSNIFTNKIEEKRQKISLSVTRSNAMPEVKMKRSLASQKMWQNEDYANKQIKIQTLSHNTKKYKEKQSKIQSVVQNRPEVKLKKSISCSISMGTPEARKRQSVYAKKTQNDPIVRARRHATLKNNKSFGKSKMASKFLDALSAMYKNVVTEKKLFGFSIDFYITDIDVYIEFDGVYWHGLDRPIENIRNSLTPQDRAIFQNYQRDQKLAALAKQNNISLVRVTDKEFKKEIKHNNVEKWISERINE